VPGKVRVNVISPGPIDTGVFADVPQEFRNKFVSKIPMGRFGRQEEVATAALFLASDDSALLRYRTLYRWRYGTDLVAIRF